MDGFFASLGYGNFIIVLSVLVFVHELGHYLVARMCGVRVETFSIGFGKELFGWSDKAGTRWKISLIPLGGYVKMFGEASTPGEKSGLHKNLSSDEIKYSFAHKSLAQRSAVVAAGPMANFLFAILALAAMFFFVGKPTPTNFMETGIGSVVEGSAAADAGFKAGDIIERVDDININQFSDLVSVVTNSQGQPLEFYIVRDGIKKIISVTPRRQKVQISATEMKEAYRIGIGVPPMSFVRQGVSESIWSGVKETWKLTIYTLQAVLDMITGKTGVENMGGPVKIAQMSSDVGDMGGVAILSFMAILSINLGLLNLFPVPMLDGGHLLFYFFEAILRRPLSAKIQEFFLRIGLALLLFLMVFVTINDIVGITF